VYKYNLLHPISLTFSISSISLNSPAPTPTTHNLFFDCFFFFFDFVVLGLSLHIGLVPSARVCHYRPACVQHKAAAQGESEQTAYNAIRRVWFERKFKRFHWLLKSFSFFFIFFFFLNHTGLLVHVAQA
jgi:hypothetical protein